MNGINQLDASEIHAMMSFSSGELRWKIRPVDQFGSPAIAHITNKKFAGKLVRGRNTRGYRTFRVSVRDRIYHLLFHRVIWCLLNGDWPDGILDHFDGNSLNNDPSNLRVTDQSGNRMNMRRRMDNSSGVTGVRFNKSKRKWEAAICVRGKRTNLGTFASFDEAATVRLDAQHRLGFGPAHGAEQ